MHLEMATSEYDELINRASWCRLKEQAVGFSELKGMDLHTSTYQVYAHMSFISSIKRQFKCMYFNASPNK